MRQEQLTGVTDWGKTNQLKNLERLCAYVQKGNWFMIVPCGDPKMVLNIRQRSRAGGMFGCWVGFGSTNGRPEDFVAVTAESRREHDFRELQDAIVQQLRTALLFGNNSELTLVSAPGDRSQPLRSQKKRWIGKVEELQNAYAAIQGYPCFLFEGEYDMSVGRAMLENAKKTKRPFWKLW